MANVRRIIYCAFSSGLCWPPHGHILGGSIWYQTKFYKLCTLTFVYPYTLCAPNPSDYVKTTIVCDYPSQCDMSITMTITVLISVLKEANQFNIVDYDTHCTARTINGHCNGAKWKSWIKFGAQIGIKKNNLDGFSPSFSFCSRKRQVCQMN